MKAQDYIIAAKALRLDEGEWTEEDHPRDEKGMFVASGNTFEHKDALKAAGFRFNGPTKEWHGDAGSAAKLGSR